MTARLATRRRAGRGRRPHARRRAVALLGGAALLGVAIALIAPTLNKAVREVTLPLRHEDIIRQQARAKHLDAALIAGVIYAESKFRDATSPTGAKGLMQIQPETAKLIARRTGGSRFEVADLGTPQINIAYGSYYLRYLLDHYDDNVVPTVAAYNAGLTRVDSWIAESGRGARGFTADQVRFAETRAYVARVLQARNDYRHNYAHELGL